MPLMFVMLLIGVIFVLVGALVLRSGATSAEGYVRARARVYMNPASDGGMVRPVVEFEVNGQTVRKTCQPLRSSQFLAAPGDEIDVLYRSESSLGMETISVMVDTGDDPAAGHAQANKVMGWILVAVGAIALAIAGFAAIGLLLI